MSVRMRAAFVGAILALFAAPAADAAKKKSSFKLSGVKVSKSTVTAGDKVRVSGKAANRKGRKAGKATVIYSLRTTRSAKSGKRLGKSSVKRTKGGKSRRFGKTLTVPASTAERTYYAFACTKGKKASCGKKKVAVKGKPPGTPGTPGTPGDNRSVAKRLADGVTFDGMFKHLQAFQNIATANGGNRASGFPGYDASGQYVIDQLTAAGYTPVKQVFDFVVFTETEFPVFQRTAPGATVTYEPPDDDTPDDAQFATMSYSEAGDVTQTLDLRPEPDRGRPRLRRSGLPGRGLRRHQRPGRPDPARRLLLRPEGAQRADGRSRGRRDLQQHRRPAQRHARRELPGRPGHQRHHHPGGGHAEEHRRGPGRRGRHG